MTLCITGGAAPVVTDYALRWIFFNGLILDFQKRYHKSLFQLVIPHRKWRRMALSNLIRSIPPMEICCLLLPSRSKVRIHRKYRQCGQSLKSDSGRLLRLCQFCHEICCEILFFVVFNDSKTGGNARKKIESNVKILSFLNKSITAGVCPGGRETSGKSQRFALRKDKESCLKMNSKAKSFW